MSNYKDIVGTAVRNNAGNIPSPEAGQVWFDSTNLDFKYQFANLISSWRTSVSINTARDFTTGAGTTTSALCFGGLKPPGEVLMGETESWNGSAWTEVSDLNTARQDLGGAGADNTSAIAIGGGTPDKTANNETWNGSSWTEVNDLNTTRRGTEQSAGIATSALCMGGDQDPPGTSALNESWNGSSWTEVADLNTGRARGIGTGASNTAALCVGGAAPSATGAT